MSANKFLQAKLLQWRNEREIKYFKFYENFRSNYRAEIIPRKFYSKHDALDLCEADPVIVDEIMKYNEKTPKDKYAWPVLSSHEYGWWSKPLVELDRNDKRFYRPAKITPETKHELLTRKTQFVKKVPFTGIPWK